MSNKSNLKIYPNQNASAVSKLFFCWALPLFYQRYQHEVTEDEFFKPLNSHESAKLGDRLERAWREKSPSLWRALIKVFWLEFAGLGLMFLTSEFILKMSQPWLIGKLMGYSTSNTTVVVSQREIYVYASLVILNSFFSVLLGQFYIFLIQHLGMKIRIACSSLLYRKALRINRTTLSKFSISKMVNLLSNDMNRFDLAAMHLLQLLVAPIEVIVFLWFLCSMVGFTTIPGIIFLFTFLPVQMIMAKIMSSYRLRTANKTDQRIKLMNEVIAGIQMIKMYTWERPFSEMIKEARKIEIHQIKIASYLRALNNSFMLFLNRTGIFLCVLTYVLYHHQVDAKYVFVVTGFFAILRQTLTVYIPFGINNFSETRISVQRITEFLTSDEVSTSNYEQEITTYIQSNDEKLIKDESATIKNYADSQVQIQLEDVSAKWDKVHPDYCLKNVNFSCTSPELIAVVGAVGSGKSSLLHSILGELNVVGGKVHVNGTVSYAAQEPWIFSGSIRENIIVGSAYDPDKYHRVVDVCGLRQDFSVFPHGDSSETGERGVALSGGQKARVNLARAVYKNADIYLLDDPTSAVDVNVAKHIFQNCILNYLRDKSVVLITNNHDYLDKVDKVYLMKEGRIEEMDKDSKITTSLQNETCTELEQKFLETKQKAQPVVQAEPRKSGAVSKHVYQKYFLSGGNWFSLLVIALLFILTQSSASGADYFVAFWVDVAREEQTIFTTQVCIYIYVGLIVSCILVAITRSMAYFRFCMKASVNLHNQMFAKIIRTTIYFFNVNPSGRILNRFSKDIGLIDETIPIVMMDTFQIALIVLGSILILIFLNPWILLPSFVIATLFYHARIAFLRTSRNLKRVEAAARSPIYSHLTGSLNGLSTIRTLGVQKMLSDEFDYKQNLHTSTNYMFFICTRAFGFWLDMSCVFYMLVVVVSILSIDIRPGIVGLAITQSMNLTGVFQWGMKQWSELENQMIAVERVVEYGEISPEVEDGGKSPPKNWPDIGAIQFKEVYLRYPTQNFFTLNNITISIAGREKIGIVGRTGAGKSSLVSALFRLFQIDGQILIDNVNISTIPLDCLRSSISIIPQEPMLFSGNLRTNLDPFHKYSDEQIWRALEQVQLRELVADLPRGLSTEIMEGGSNFSVGQRQLICLTRAVLQDNRILILDEATASIDSHTDQLLQVAIKTIFRNCTVLTVAHRLHTVKESDKILVMDGGRVAEFDEPGKLLQDSKSLFYKLVRESGI